MKRKIIFLLTSLTLLSFVIVGFKTNEKQSYFQSLTNSEKNTITVFTNTVKSVVHVSNIRKARSWDYGEVEVPAGMGSGFVWDKNGHIVTNAHVVAGGDSFLISFHKDKKQYKAKLIGTSRFKDLAVLKLIERPATLTPIKLGDSLNLFVGQQSFALGNPLGFDYSITMGILSALDRKIVGYGGTKIYGVIQTDAAINRGNSGGPLLDSLGQVIGVNTMIVSPSGSSAGLGFAIPVNTVKRIVPQLIKHGRVMRPILGFAPLREELKYQLGIRKGIVIRYVDPKSGAGKAGLRAIGQDRYGHVFLGDIILEVNGTAVNSFNDIYHVLEKFKIGDQVTVKYLRDNSIKTTKIKLTELK